MEFDGLCNVGQTAGSMPGSAGEPSQGPYSFLTTREKERDVKPGREVLLLGLLAPTLLPEPRLALCSQ